MNGYVKLFDSIFMSTVWQEDNPTRIVWITLLGKKDRDGIVEGSIPGLAHLARVSIPEAEAAINKFLAPDPHSRTSDYEGRRIEAIDGGWRVLNHEKYRDLLSREDKLQRDRVRQQRHRERTRHTESVTKRDARDMSQMSHHPDAVAEAENSTPQNEPDDGEEIFIHAVSLYPEEKRSYSRYTQELYFQAIGEIRNGHLSDPEAVSQLNGAIAAYVARQGKFCVGFERFMRDKTWKGLLVVPVEKLNREEEAELDRELVAANQRGEVPSESEYRNRILAKRKKAVTHA